MQTRMRGEVKFPDGFYYFPDFLSVEEEKELLIFFQSLEYEKIRIYDQDSKREVAHFGIRYDFATFEALPGPPFPPLIDKLKGKCAELAGIKKETIVQCLISHYPTGAPIGWHRDKFVFGSTVIGVSLQSSCKMQFQKKEGIKRYVYEQVLAPRSAYLLSGAARYKWEHSIPPVKESRYSITYRTAKK